MNKNLTMILAAIILIGIYSFADIEVFQAISTTCLVIILLDIRASCYANNIEEEFTILFEEPDDLDES